MIGTRLAPFAAVGEWLWARKFKVLTLVFGVAFLGVASSAYLGFGISDVPLWGWVFIGSSVAAAPVGLIVGVIIVVVLYSPDGVPLHEIDPVDGDAAGHLISEEKWDDLIAVDSKGREVEKTQLHTINTLLGVGYEVKRYNPDTNVAQLSFAAETKAVELRRNRQTVEALDEQYSDVVDNLVEVRARHKHATREAVKDSTMEMLTIMEGIDVPAGENFVTDIINEKTEEARIDEMATIDDVAGELDYEEDPTLDMDSLNRGDDQ